MAETEDPKLVNESEVIEVTDFVVEILKCNGVTDAEEVIPDVISDSVDKLASNMMEFLCPDDDIPVDTQDKTVVEDKSGEKNDCSVRKIEIPPKKPIYVKDMNHGLKKFSDERKAKQQGSPIEKPAALKDIEKLLKEKRQTLKIGNLQFANEKPIDIHDELSSGIRNSMYIQNRFQSHSEITSNALEKTVSANVLSKERDNCSTLKHKINEKQQFDLGTKESNDENKEEQYKLCRVIFTPNDWEIMFKGAKLLKQNSHLMVDGRQNDAEAEIKLKGMKLKKLKILVSNTDVLFEADNCQCKTANVGGKIEDAGNSCVFKNELHSKEPIDAEDNNKLGKRTYIDEKKAEHESATKVLRKENAEIKRKKMLPLKRNQFEQENERACNTVDPIHPVSSTGTVQDEINAAIEKTIDELDVIHSDVEIVFDALEDCRHVRHETSEVLVGNAMELPLIANNNIFLSNNQSQTWANGKDRMEQTCDPVDLMPPDIEALSCMQFEIDAEIRNKMDEIYAELEGMNQQYEPELDIGINLDAQEERHIRIENSEDLHKNAMELSLIEKDRELFLSDGQTETWGNRKNLIEHPCNVIDPGDPENEASTIIEDEMFTEIKNSVCAQNDFQPDIEIIFVSQHDSVGGDEKTSEENITRIPYSRETFESILKDQMDTLVGGNNPLQHACDIINAVPPNIGTPLDIQEVYGEINPVEVENDYQSVIGTTFDSLNEPDYVEENNCEVQQESARKDDENHPQMKRQPLKRKRDQ